MSAPMKAPPLRRLSIANRKIKLLIYGPPGAGKTTFGGTAIHHPAMRDVLVLSIDRGESSIASMGDFTCVQINTSKDLEDTLWALSQRSEGYENFKSIIVDGISELQTVELEYLVSLDKKREHADDVQIQDYGLSSRRIARILRMFRDSDCHLILTAWSKSIYPKRGIDARKVTKEEIEPLKIAPNMTDSLQTALMGYMDFVWYIDTNPENGRRGLITQTSGVFQAKTRGNRFAPALGTFVQLKDPAVPGSDGHDLASIYDLLLETETFIEKVESTNNNE